MIDTYKSITVLVICYKQQGVIKRALDSVLCQKEYGLNKIVVCDDCSPDNTWNVLQDYKSRYPEHFEIHRNEHNLGIYRNMEKLLSLRGESDLFVNLSGDDTFEDGFFKAVQRYVATHDINFSIPFGIYANYKVIFPNGKQKIHDQKFVTDTSLNLFSLYIRQKLSGRSMMVNNRVLQLQKPTVYDKGLNLAESLFDCQKHIIIEKAYFVPVVGNVYYCGIGVSVKLFNTDYFSTQLKEKWYYFLEHLISTQKDINYANAEIQKCNFILIPSLKYYIKALYFFFQSGYPSFPSYKEYKFFTYPMKKRMFLKYEKNLIMRIIEKIIYQL